MSDDPRSQNPDRSDWSQAEAIALLQQSIQQLDRVLQEVRRPEASLPPQSTLERLVATTNSLKEAFTPQSISEPFAPVATAGSPSHPREPEPAPSKIDRVLPDLDHLDSWWDRLLSRIRGLLPGHLGESLSDWALTGILTAIAVSTLVISVVLLPKSATEIAQNFRSEPQSPPSLSSQPSEPLSPEPSLNPPELIAPTTPEIVPIDPSPIPKFTPEQSLLSSIQKDLSSLTQNYSDRLIQSIQADFIASRLEVTVSDDWYALDAGRQDRLAGDVWKRSRQLNFRQLNLSDRQGNLVARNPVVGDNIVVLHRHQEGES